MAMSDDFLLHMRAAPPPHFIASLKTRLDQLDRDLLTRRQKRRRGFFVGCMIAGAALATGLFAARNMYSPPADGGASIPIANPSLVDDQHAGSAPRATGPTTDDLAIAPPGKAT